MRAAAAAAGGDNDVYRTLVIDRPRHNIHNVATGADMC